VTQTARMTMTQVSAISHVAAHAASRSWSLCNGILCFFSHHTMVQDGGV
jgi:hypothetical protein